MPGLVPGIHVFVVVVGRQSWMAGTRLRPGFAGATHSLDSP
jgi:hypothetical protein